VAPNSSIARQSRRILLAIQVIAVFWGGTAHAGDSVRIAAQRVGTLGWELDVIRAHGLDKARDLTIAVTELASTEAAKIALRAGTVDIIVSDWLWVARERSLGAKLAFIPYSSALGAVMVPAASKITNLRELSGHKLGVAGGPLDKNWLLLQAAERQEGVDLRTAATIVYGTPALLAEKAVEGELDATLNYWNFCAALEARGLRRLAGIEDELPKLGAKDRPAMLGYVFDERWAGTHADALTRFLAVDNDAKELLATSEVEWERIAPLVGTRDDATLKLYRDRYREGIPRRPIAEEEADARILYRVLATIGGKELVGAASALDRGTFYHPPPGH
jgi:NitT/TauT family transport system substrate-binding protein